MYVRKRKRFSIHWLIPEMATMAGAEPAWSQNPRASSSSSKWVRGIPTLGPSSGAFSMPLAGNGIGSGTSRTRTRAPVGCQHCWGFTCYATMPFLAITSYTMQQRFQEWSLWLRSGLFPMCLLRFHQGHTEDLVHTSRRGHGLHKQNLHPLLWFEGITQISSVESLILKFGGETFVGVRIRSGGWGPHDGTCDFIRRGTEPWPMLLVYLIMRCPPPH